MIACIQVQPTDREYTYRVFLTNHTDTLRITEIYSYNKGMDGDHYPDYMSEHEIISQIITGISTIKDIISQARVASYRYNKELDTYVYGKGWTANFQIFNNVLKYRGIEDVQFPSEDQELPEPPKEIVAETDEDLEPIGDFRPEPGELLINPGVLCTDALPWGAWVRDSCARAFETAKHYNKLLYFCDQDGIVKSITNIELAEKFRNLGDNPNLLNSYQEAYDELRADLGVSYFFENENKVSE